MLLCGIIAAGGVARAQALNDPTRPPYGAYEGESSPAAPAGGPVLQSVMITPDRKAAIISGVMVRLGEKYGSAQVVQISETEVVLREGGESQVLKLYPGVDKRRVGSAGANAGSGATR
jgi:MSHA biogenesis protein MshK